MNAPVVAPVEAEDAESGKPKKPDKVRSVPVGEVMLWTAPWVAALMILLALPLFATQPIPHEAYL